MAKNIGDIGKDGAGISEGHEKAGTDNLNEILVAVLADITDLRTKYAALLTKMDTDFTGQNGAVTSSELDVDYASTGALATAELEA